MRRVVIFGVSQLAELVYAYLSADDEYDVVGFTVDEEYRDGDTFFDLPLVPFAGVEEIFPPAEHEMFVATGYQKMNALRQARCADARSLGYSLASWVHPTSFVSPLAELGDNTLILEYNVIQPYARIGDGAIFNVQNGVGHHCDIGSYCFFSSHVIIAGGTRVGPRCFFGPASFVRDGIELGQESLVGAGCIVMANAPERSIFAQEPTKPCKRTTDLLREI